MIKLRWRRYPNASENTLLRTGKPGVLIWRDHVLPNSETFIVNQMRAFRRYTVDIAGLSHIGNHLGVSPSVSFAGSTAYFRLRRRAFLRYGLSPALTHRIRSFDGRVVLAHFGPDALSILPFCRRRNLPLVVTFHGYDVTSRRDTWSPAYRDNFEGLISSATLLVAVSQFVARRLIELGAPREKVVLNYIGIPIDRTFTSQVEMARSGILFVGRLVDVKGTADLIDAALRLRDWGVKPIITIIGDGPNRSALETAARSAGLDNVRFMGTQSPETVGAVMRRHQVLCVPSKTAPDGAAEAFNLASVEAAAHGLPVVAYRHGGIPEAVADGATGILVPEGDIDGLAKALRDMVLTPARAARYGRAGRSRVLRNFDIERTTAHLETLLDLTWERA